MVIWDGLKAVFFTLVIICGLLLLPLIGVAITFFIILGIVYIGLKELREDKEN